MPVIYVVLAGHRSEDEYNVIIPDHRDLFRAGRSLAPKGDLGWAVEFRPSADE